MDGDVVPGSCAVHPSKPATSYCAEHCLSMCIACLLTDHKHCIDHVQAINTADDDVDCHTSHTGEIERICDRLSTNISDVKHRKSAWVDNLSKVEKELVMGLRNMRHRIVQRVDSLCTEAMDMTKSVLKEHRKMYEADVEDLVEFQHRLKEIKRRLCQIKNPGDIMALERQLDQIRKEFQQRNMKSGDIKVHFHVSDMVSRLERGDLDTFGELCVEDVTERVRSLYLSPSEIQRLSTDLLDKKANAFVKKKDDEPDLFVTDKNDDPRDPYNRPLAPSPNGSVSPIIWPGMVRDPPPLPTLERRRLFPPMITLNPPQQDIINNDKGVLHGTREASGLEEKPKQKNGHEDDKRVIDVGDLKLSIPNLPSRCNQDRIPSLGDYTTADPIMFYQPNDDQSNQAVKNENSQPAQKSGEDKLSMPKLPIRYQAPFDQKNSDNVHGSNDILALRNGSTHHYRRNGHGRNTQYQTLPRSHKQHTRKHSHDNNDSLSRANVSTTERPISTTRNCSDGCYSNSSGRDSGIVLSQELSFNKTESADSTQLKIPKLPTKDARKLSDPLPCFARRESVDTNKGLTDADHEILANNTASETDPNLPEKHDNGDMTYIRAKETNPDVEIKYKEPCNSCVEPSVPKNQDSVIGKNKRLVKSVGLPSDRGNYQIIYADIILDATSGGRSQHHKAKNAPFITAMAALDGGYFLVCDYRNNAVETYDSYGLLKDAHQLNKPFGCCRMGENRFAVTSKDPPKISLFSSVGSRMNLDSERLIDTASDVFGVSFSNGFFCLSCQTEVKLLRNQPQEQETQIRPLARHGKPRGSWFKTRLAKPFFSDVQYAIMEKLGERFYIFTSDIKKKQVTSVGLNGMVIWNQSNIEPKTLAYYNQQVLVAADHQVVLLHAGSGHYIRAIRDGIPRNPWSIAVDEDLFPCLMVSGCGKTCARQVTRVALEPANEHLLTEVHYV